MARSSIVGFRDVDASHDPADLIRYLQAVSEVPFVRNRAQAHLARSRIEPGQVVADLGCGLGGDTIMLAHRVGPGGRAIGIDRSRAMLDHTRGRADAAGLPVGFCQGDIRSLPFDDASLDACWMERVLIYADDPAAVLAEVRRVLRPGGQAVVQEYDYRALLYDAPDAELCEMLRAGVAAAFAQPEIGASLLRHAHAAGFATLELATDLPRWPDFEWSAAAGRWRELLARLVEEGTVTEARAETWWRYMRTTFEEGRGACFFASFTLFTTR